MTEETLLDNSSDIDTSKGFYEQLVGPQAKFKDNESLAKGKYQSDLYVKDLERRLDEMRADLLAERTNNQTGATLSELIKKLETRDTSNNQPPVNVDPVQSPPQFKPEDVEMLAMQALSKHETAKRQQENWKQAQAKLIETFGSNYQAEYKQRLDDLGLSAEYGENLAKTSPKAFASTFGLDQKVRDTFQAPPRSEGNFRPKGAEKVTYETFQELRKKNPRAYHDPKIQQQMFNLALNDPDFQAELMQSPEWNSGRSD